MKNNCRNYVYCKEITSSEIEGVTFRKVKELWIEKKYSEMSGEEKDILKSISIQFLGKLLQRSRKRSREDRFVYISHLLCHQMSPVLPALCHVTISCQRSSQPCPVS